MEEDAGKSLHLAGETETLIDLNRAGVPLIEIVSEPDLRSSEEAYAYLSEIKKLVVYLGICDGNMEEGSLRCDANISVMRKGAEKYGTRVEVKNMNSFRNVQRAIEYEIARQIKLVEAGGVVDGETRGFDALSGTTSSQRSKESMNDYRYFPEPDLPPLHITDAQLEAVRAEMPALPHALYKRFTQEYGLSDYDASVLTDQKNIALYYAELAGLTSNHKAASNWVMGGAEVVPQRARRDRGRLPAATFGAGRYHCPDRRQHRQPLGRHQATVPVPAGKSGRGAGRRCQGAGPDSDFRRGRAAAVRRRRAGRLPRQSGGVPQR